MDQDTKMRILNVIISLDTCVVYVTHINSILSSPNWICFGYKTVLTIRIGMVCAICVADTVAIKHSISYDKD